MRLLAILATSCFVSSMSMRIIDPVVPDISRDLGVSPSSVAMLASLYAFPYALSQPLLGAFGDAFGKARIIKIALAVLACCLAASAFAPTLGALAVLRLVGGAAAGGIIPLAFAIVGDRVPMTERQLALSRVLTAIIAGQLTGSIGSGFIASFFGWRVAQAAAAALTVAAFLVTVRTLQPAQRTSRIPPARGELFAGYRAVFANPLSVVCFSAVFVEGIVIFGLFPYVAVLLEQRGAGGLREAGFVLAGFGFGGFVYTALVRMMLGRLGIYKLILAGGIVSGLGFCLLTLGGTWPTEMAIFMIVGVGFYMIHNSLQTQATELAPANRGSAVAAHAFFVFLGQAFGPIIYGAGLESVGTSTVLLVSGAVMALLGAATAYGLKSRSALPVSVVSDEA
jgi:predicted MFS family arabinose efflux permease